MSHVNDFIGVVRGLRQVVEASIKLQQESSKLIWNNSSFKPLIHNCPTNISTFKTNVDSPKDLLERAVVVVHGLRQYALMHVPNFKPNIEKQAMDSQLQEEIEQLNKEFDKTFETLRRSQVQSSENVSAVTNDDIAIPLEKLKSQADRLKVKPIVAPKVLEYVSDVKVKSVSSDNVDQSQNTSISKPVVKKKLKVSVGIYDI